LFSDGFKDQFGGFPPKKLNSTAFNNLLKSIAFKDANEQHQILADFLNNWTKASKQAQIDDVIVLGLVL
jgi:hypothetical protein